MIFALLLAICTKKVDCLSILIIVLSSLSLSLCLSVYFTGSFGNGVLSFFTFLKWLLFLNIYTFIVVLCFVIIPQSFFKYELPLQTANLTSPSNVTSPVLLPTVVGRVARAVILPEEEIEPLPGSNSNFSSGPCNLVRPNTSYTDKPVAQLAGDFMAGVVSRTLTCFVCVCVCVCVCVFVA